MNDLKHIIELIRYNNGYLDVTDYPITHKDILPIPRNITQLETQLIPDLYPLLYRSGIYLQNGKNLIVYGLEYSNGNKPIYISSLQDLDNYFKYNRILYLKLRDVNRVILDIDTYKFYRKYMRDISSYTLTDEILQYINSNIMFYINREEHCVLYKRRRTSQISKIVLYPLEYLPYHSIEDFINSFKQDETVAESCMYLQDRIISIYQTLYDQILDIYLSISNTDSIRIKRISDRIIIERFLSPCKRRKIINSLNNIQDYVIY